MGRKTPWHVNHSKKAPAEGRECCVSTSGADRAGDGLPAMSRLPKHSPIVLGQLGLRVLIRDTRGTASRHTQHSVPLAPPCRPKPTKEQPRTLRSQANHPESGKGSSGGLPYRQPRAEPGPGTPHSLQPSQALSGSPGLPSPQGGAGCKPDWCPPDDHTVQKVGQPAIAGDVGEVREAPLASQEKGSEHSYPGSASTPESGSQEWGTRAEAEPGQPQHGH